MEPPATAVQGKSRNAAAAQGGEESAFVTDAHHRNRETSRVERGGKRHDMPLGTTRAQVGNDEEDSQRSHSPYVSAQDTHVSIAFR